jgi:hypothetical protein
MTDMDEGLAFGILRCRVGNAESGIAKIEVGLLSSMNDLMEEVQLLLAIERVLAS